MRFKQFGKNYLFECSAFNTTALLAFSKTLRQTLMMVFVMAGAFSSAMAQCPPATYVVGSAVGISTLSTAPPGLTYMTTGSVEVRGTFTINNGGTWTMRGVNVYLSDNSSAIFVDGNCVLDAGSNGSTPTTFDICGAATSWGGITANFSSTLKLDGCNIRNACTAVTLTALSKVQITNNTFQRNQICLRILGTINPFQGGIAHNVFDGTIPSACTGNHWAIHMTNAGYVQIGDPGQTGQPNSIIQYSLGIAAVNSNFDLYNTKFTDGVKALDLLGNGATFTANIYGLGGDPGSEATIHNFSMHGVNAKNYHVNIQRAKITGTASEVEVFKGTIPVNVDVINCRFETFGSKGVNLGESVFSRIAINNNNFRDNNTVPDYRYCVSISNSQIATGMANITGNTFNDDKKIHPNPNPLHLHVGTYINLTNGVNIGSNSYFQNYDTTAEHEYKGVFLFNADKSNVYDNLFNGNSGPAPSANVFHYHGLDNYTSSQCRLYCNQADNLNAGIHFNGAGCDGTILRMNQMSDNQDDLLLDAGTVIGQQKSQQNRWPSSSPTEARFDGNPSLAALNMSKFFINTFNMNANLWPDPRVPANDWFVTAPIPHILQIDCSEAAEDDPNTPGLTKASQMAIDGSFEPYKGYPATIFDANLFAYQSLLEHPEWRPENSPEAEFFTLHNGGNVGKLQRARNDWNSLALLPSDMEASWNNNQTAIKQKLDDINVKVGILNTAATPEKQEMVIQILNTLYDDLAVLQQTNEALTAQYTTSRTTRANLLLADLSAITTNNNWENNLKTALTLLVQKFISSTGEWSNVESAAMQGIADQCRHSGGVGVALARAALGVFHYDDEAMCPVLEERNNSKVDVADAATLSPNPAGDLCQITFNGSYSGELVLVNMQGGVQTRVQLTDATSFDLDTKSFPVGLYVVQLNDGDKNLWMGKLVIAR